MSVSTTTATLTPQENAPLRQYLDEVTQAGDVSEETARHAWKAWLRLNSEMGECLPVPDAAPGQDGELLLTWDPGELHLELEFLPDGSAEFFPATERLALFGAKSTGRRRPSRRERGSGSGCCCSR